MLCSRWRLLGLSATRMGGLSLAGGQLEVVPNVEYDEGFKHGFLRAHEVRGNMRVLWLDGKRNN